MPPSGVGLESCPGGAFDGPSAVSNQSSFWHSCGILQQRSVTADLADLPLPPLASRWNQWPFSSPQTELRPCQVGEPMLQVAANDFRDGVNVESSWESGAYRCLIVGDGNAATENIAVHERIRIFKCILIFWVSASSQEVWSVYFAGLAALFIYCVCSINRPAWKYSEDKNYSHCLFASLSLICL